MAHSLMIRPVPGDHVVICELAEQQYALPLPYVREVLLRPALAGAASAPSWCAGLLRLRGDVLPVLDLRQALGLPSCEPRISDRIVVIEVEGSTFGLIVDSVIGVQPVPELRPDRDAQRSAIVTAVYDGGDAIVSVLSTDALAEFSRLSKVGIAALSIGPEGAGGRLLSTRPGTN